MLNVAISLKRGGGGDGADRETKFASSNVRMNAMKCQGTTLRQHVLLATVFLGYIHENIVNVHIISIQMYTFKKPSMERRTGSIPYGLGANISLSHCLSRTVNYKYCYCF